MQSEGGKGVRMILLTWISLFDHAAGPARTRKTHPDTNGTAVALGDSARVFAVSLGALSDCSRHPTNPINPVAGRKTAAVPFHPDTFSLFHLFRAW